MRLSLSRSVSLAVCGAVAAASLTACGNEKTADEALNVSGTSGRSTSATAPSGGTEMRGQALGLTTDERQASTKDNTSPAASTEPNAPTTNDSRADAAANTALILTEMRIGKYQGRDRVVFEFSGEGTPGYSISYVPSPTQQGSGNKLDVPGSQYLQVLLTGQTIPMEGSPQEVSRGLVSSPDAPGVRGVYFAGQFEGVGQSVIGLDAKRPYSAFTLSNPTRLVVDLQ